MCYYNGVAIRKEQNIKLAGIEKKINQLELLLPLLNGFDYNKSIAIKATSLNDWEFVPMEWGFLPTYLANREKVNQFRNGYKDVNGKFRPPFITLNAVGEEILLPNKMFRDAALHRRCLILSTGFYEWCHVPEIGAKGQPLKKTKKIPYHIRLKNQPYFFMAAIWQPWIDKDSGEMVETFAIVTTRANDTMSAIHNSKKRMPVILPEAEAAEWIQPNCDEKRIQELAFYQLPSEKLEAYTIARNFREVSNPMERVAYDGMKNFV